MKSNDNNIRQENKKALPKFILITVASMILGAALGFVLVLFSFEDLAGALTAAGLFFTTRIAGWLLIALPIAELAVCLPVYFGAKKQLAGWDGEDETVSSRIEARLSVCMWVVGMALILSLFLVAALSSGLVQNVGTERDVGPAMFFGGIAAFLVGNLGVAVVLQQKLVDITKRLNPEKQGSVYDTRFQKKWFDSCDEAEQAIIGQCAFKAFQATGRTCLILWMLFVIGGMFFNYGFLPAMAVCIIWGVNQSAYFYSCLTLPKAKTGMEGKGVTKMEQNASNNKKLTTKEKLIIAGVTGIFAAIGAVLGVISYHQQWLG